MKEIESVQRHSTKYILNNFELEYKERLLACGLLPMSFRREFLDLVFIFNSLYGLNDYCSEFYVKFNDVGSQRYRNENNIVCRGPVPKSDKYYFFYTNRVVRLWNSLPEEIKNIEINDNGTNGSFKKVVKKYLFEKLHDCFDSNDTCSWLLVCRCKNCRPS